MRGYATLRKVNTVLSVVMMALFLLHGVGNAFLVMSFGRPTAKALARAIVALAVVHGIIGVGLTVPTVRAMRESGTSYGLLNARFWAVRASGVAIAVFVALHMAVFLQVGGGGPYRLKEYGVFELAVNICLVLSVAVHVLCNARPLVIALGMSAPRSRAADFAFALALLLLLMGVSFVVYFVRWIVI
jgi:succinate dehydrogenase hydrophobic anchor subunit